MNWNGQAVKHYYQNKGRQGESQTENHCLGTGDVNASAS